MMSKLNIVNLIIFIIGIFMVVFMLSSSPNNQYSQIDSILFLLIGVVLMMSAWIGFLITKNYK